MAAHEACSLMGPSIVPNTKGRETTSSSISTVSRYPGLSGNYRGGRTAGAACYSCSRGGSIRVATKRLKAHQQYNAVITGQSKSLVYYQLYIRSFCGRLASSHPNVHVLCKPVGVAVGRVIIRNTQAVCRYLRRTKEHIFIWAWWAGFPGSTPFCLRLQSHQSSANSLPSPVYLSRSYSSIDLFSPSLLVDHSVSIARGVRSRSIPWCIGHNQGAYGCVQD
ncbi:hypothetical protein M747DRAFT_362634 [Aspergillus niger ATCC 13496]|uniref:Uncharacterized protein n=3 Tax=Aspergillus niger TaxID=5061 RepID=A2R6K0_ASPNC|nr:hypothetical protein An16g00280 [Aspergillus niger]RDH14552.1 hypothetical protein M747DRAFT_362634 [Aspergillus niger ATCC 13496]CAK42708.1 hypothetical protein An16g00280 [Aspergillus niger]